MRTTPFLPALGCLVLLVGLAATAAAEPAATGPFAPVAEQLQANLKRLPSPAPAVVGTERIELLLATGQADEAARELGRLRGEARAVAVTKVRVHLARQDFAAAEPIVKRIAARPDPDDRERQVLYAWAWAHDDAARVDALSRTASPPRAAPPRCPTCSPPAASPTSCCTTIAPSPATPAPSNAPRRRSPPVRSRTAGSRSARPRWAGWPSWPSSTATTTGRWPAPPRP